MASLSERSSGFLINTCAAPLPCDCILNGFIECDNKQLRKVPIFTKYVGHSPYLNIILDHNRLTTIPSHVFENISSASTQEITIDLDNNFISVIEIGAFAGIENLVKDLELENNYLTHLPLALKELSSVKSIGLLGNPLLNLDASVLAALSNTLKIFYVDINRFASFPGDIDLLSTLTDLTMTGFNLSVINSTAFNGFEDTLTRLQISHAKFHHVPVAVCRPIMKTCPCKVNPPEPHFYIEKLGFAGVYLFFLFLLQNIDCGYSLEPPRRGGSNGYPQSMF